MRLFSRGSEDEEGAFGQEVTGTSKHSDSYYFDEARPKRDFSGRRREDPETIRRSSARSVGKSTMRRAASSSEDGGSHVNDLFIIYRLQPRRLFWRAAWWGWCAVG